MKYTIMYKGNKIAEVEAKNERYAVQTIYPKAILLNYHQSPDPKLFTVEVYGGEKNKYITLITDFDIGATVSLTKEDKNRVYELCNKYPEEYIADLNQVFYRLYQEKIIVLRNLDGIIIQHLLIEATSEENSKTLRKIFLCMARGLEWCSEEDLDDAGIVPYKTLKRYKTR